MAGLWEQVRRVLTSATETTTTGRRRRPAPVTGGPDACSLVSADEIEAATGNRPLGPGDPKSGGTQTDIGLFKVCQWRLTGGDEFLVNVTVCRDEASIDLARSRNWNEEKPLPGVGEVGRFKIGKDPDGGTEIHITAFQGRYVFSFVHSSAGGSRDIEPLKALMLKVLART
jgi:hypothetical protein